MLVPPGAAAAFGSCLPVIGACAVVVLPQPTDLPASNTQLPPSLAPSSPPPPPQFTVGYVGDQYEASLRSSRFCLAPYG